MRAAFVADLGWSAAGLVAPQAAQWVVVAILARLGGPEAVGALALALAIVSPLNLLAGMQLRTVLASGPEITACAALRLRLASALATMAGTLAICWALGAAPPLAVLVAAARGLEGLAEVGQGYAQRDRRFAASGLAQLLRAALQVGGGAGAAWAFGGSAVAMVAGMVAADLVVLLAVELRWCRARTAGLAGTAALFRLAAPLGLVLAAGALAQSLPRVALERSSGAGELGLLAAAAYLAMAASVPLSGAGGPVMVRLAEAWRAGQPDRARRLALLAGAVSALAGVLAALALLEVGGWALRLAFGAGFAGAGALMPAIASAVALECLAAPPGWVLTAGGFYRGQLLAAGAGLAAAAAVAWWLVPTCGADGAAWAIAAAVAGRLLVLGPLAIRAMRILASRPAPDMLPTGSRTEPCA